MGSISPEPMTGTVPAPLGSFPESGIDVLIVGTGLAGLTAAIECTRKGHQVRILERNPDINTAGDMYFMGLSATKFMKHWPELAQEFDEMTMHNAWIETLKHNGEQMIKPLKTVERLKAVGLDPKTPPGTFQMRPFVYRMFVRQIERLGISLEFNKRVTEYFEDEATGKGIAVTEEGQRYEADIVIAADGVGSKSQKLVGGQVRAQKSGRAMWRAAFPRSELDKNPEVKEFFHLINGTDPIVRTWLGPSTYGLALSRADVMVWIVNHDATGSESESWNSTIEIDEVLEGLDKVPGPTKWASIFKDLVKCTPPKTILNFELLWRNPQGSWLSPNARVVQIGDAAHSFLPASGNGATQAIEDAVCLASCLQIGGKENIAQSTRAHVKMRFLRNACAQKLGFANAELLQDTKWEDVKVDPRRATPALPKWIWRHDPEVYAHENYDKVVEAVKQNKGLDEDDSIPPNYPPGYRWSPWRIEDIIAEKKAGKEFDLGPGDWS